jgi:pyruvate ferredoxin oxidoreductase gamma subunit
VQEESSYAGRLLAADFTTLVLAVTATLASLSTALGVAAACLIGLTIEDSLAALQDELHDAQLTPMQMQANQQLARQVYERVQLWQPVQDRHHEAESPPVTLVDMPYAAPAMAAPSVYAIGNAPQRRTGNWRQFRPVLQRQRCTRCWLCFVWCPEAAISLDAEDYPQVDYEVCKGCLLCAHECPTQAFSVEKESR